MSVDADITRIKQDLSIVGAVFDAVVKILPAFHITDERVLPYGLRPHTRSISWITEQVITQQTKYHGEAVGVDEVDIDMPDTCLHDCVIHKGAERYYVNVKITNAATRDNKNDIAAVEKLYMQYRENPSYRLIYACFGILFENVRITFVSDYIHLFSPQFLPIYVNPRNDKIQAFYKHEPQYRTRDEFLSLLRQNSRSIVLE